MDSLLGFTSTLWDHEPVCRGRARHSVRAGLGQPGERRTRSDAPDLWFMDSGARIGHDRFAGATRAFCSFGSGAVGNTLQSI